MPVTTLMSYTRQKILETLSQQGALPVEAIARGAHLSIMATRYHLARLAQEHLIVRLDAERHGRVGRPKGMYALSESAFTQLPQPHARVLECLLSELESGLGRKTARALAERTGKRIAEMAPVLPVKAGIQARLTRAASYLTQMGYAAAVDREGGTVSLIIRRCPYLQVTKLREQVCEMDRAIIGSLLGSPFVMTDSMQRGKTHCQFVMHSRN